MQIKLDALYCMIQLHIKSCAIIKFTFCNKLIIIQPRFGILVFVNVLYAVELDVLYTVCKFSSAITYIL